MKRHCFGWPAFALVLALACSAAAQTTVDETRAVKPDGIVQISNVSGTVRVVAWDRAEVRVTGELERNVERVDFEVRDGRTSIRVVVPERPGGNKEAHLTVSAPAGSRLDVSGVSASVSVEDAGPPAPEARLRESVNVKTVSGDIEVRAWASAVELKSVSGEVSFTGGAETLDCESTSGDIEFSGAHTVDARTISGEIEGAGAASVRLRSTSGDITATDVGHDAEASSISGDIEAAVASIDKVALRTVSGSVGLRGSLAPAGRINVSTQSGGVQLTLPAEVSAQFDLSSMSGRIRTDFGVNGGGMRGDVDLTLGSGDGYVRVSTTSGSITIDKF